MAPAFLLNLVPYAILRDIGCDPFLAFQLLLVVLSLVCFVASLVIATRYLQVRALDCIVRRRTCDVCQ